MLVHLDVSRNELWDIPSTTITSLPNVTRLNISRNWFTELPTGIGQLTKLQKLNASHNMLRSSQSALLLLPLPLSSSSSTIITSSDNNNNNTNTTSYATKKDDVDSDRDNDKEETTSILRSLKHLVELDLTFNQKCSHQKTKDKVAKELYNYNNNNNHNHNHSCCTLKMTINFPPPPPSPLSEGTNNITDFIGSSAAVRDPGLLRSQLECWSTTALRRRLVADFGEVPTNPSSVSRGTVMEKLLALYAKEEQEQESQRHCQPQDRNDNNNNHDKVRGLRKIVYADGRLVQDESLRNELLVALMGWKASWTETNNERASINANNYMILTSPESWDGAGLGRKKKWKAQQKLKKYQTIWNLAKNMLHGFDENFAQQYTALAVTHNFIGSPHIDRQNVCPFYGISLGNFDDGTGGIMVECSARIVCKVNTKNRLSKIDGRFPHWVANYSASSATSNNNIDRYSLIYYQTLGEYQPIGSPIFDDPKETK